MQCVVNKWRNRPSKGGRLINLLWRKNFTKRLILSEKKPNLRPERLKNDGKGLEAYDVVKKSGVIYTLFCANYTWFCVDLTFLCCNFQEFIEVAFLNPELICLHVNSKKSDKVGKSEKKSNKVGKRHLVSNSYNWVQSANWKDFLRGTVLIIS